MIAPDGVMVPLLLVYKKGLVKNGQNPVWLYAYGAYGISTDPGFSSNRLSMLNRGFIYAIAHIRGGADMGRAQRCGAVPAEVLLYSQLAKDLAETAGGEPAYQAFLAAGAAARERQPDNCQAVLTRFDAAMEELYKLNGRSPDQND